LGKLVSKEIKDLGVKTVGMQEWRSCQVEGWEVNESGVVRRIKNKRLLKPHRHKDGYVVYMTHRSGKFVHLYAHQAVAYAWYGPCPDGMEVDHRDRRRANNHYTNLRYVTKAVNLAQRVWNAA
jgi:hypothetical protein